MAQVIETVSYRCTDDCVQSGCPGHSLILAFHSTSNSFTAEFGDGGRIGGFTSKLEALLDAVQAMNTHRKDFVSHSVTRERL